MSLAIPRLDALLHTARFIWTHPLASRNRRAALTRWLRWQLGSRLLPGSAVVSLVDDVVMLVDAQMTGATGNVYVGLQEFADMGFVMHFLREVDRFLDVGANVGAYTLLAAGGCGAHCVAAEPIAKVYDRLVANVRMNGLDAKVRALNIGLSSTAGVLRFTRSLDTINHVLAAGENAKGGAIEVDVSTVDAVVGDETPTLIKIDVEGFEAEVLAGAESTLASPVLKGLIVELNGSGARYGHDERAVHEELVRRGFAPHSYDPLNRTLCALGGKNVASGNTIYLRDPAEARRRVREARAFHVLGLSV